MFVYKLSGCGFESRSSHIGNSYSKIRVGKKVLVLLDSDSVRWLWKSRYHSQNKLRVVFCITNISEWYIIVGYVVPF